MKGDTLLAQADEKDELFRLGESPALGTSPRHARSVEFKDACRKKGVGCGVEANGCHEQMEKWLPNPNLALGPIILYL